ncbi:MAG: hypothetical protein ACXADD_20030 [Candidatus Thorarchaeota archaeon]
MAESVDDVIEVVTEAIDWLDNEAYESERRNRAIVLAIIILIPTSFILILYLATGNHRGFYYLPIAFLIGLIPFFGQTFFTPQAVGLSDHGLFFRYRYGRLVKEYSWRSIQKITAERLKGYPLVADCWKIVGIFGLRDKQNRLSIYISVRIFQLIQKEAENRNVEIE